MTTSVASGRVLFFLAASSIATIAAAGSATAAPLGSMTNLPFTFGGSAPPSIPTEPPDAGWEAQYALGLYHSKLVVDVADANAWVADGGVSGAAAVPVQLLHAEELLAAGCDGAPAERQQEKNAERALRLYYHGKWLAQRSHETAAERRYREAARIAKKARRSTLASHALSRLGYFLIYWNRHAEAREVLAESEKLNSKSNPLASFLIGSLDRQAADGDTEKLRDAEDRIIAAGQMPSQELEADQRRLIEEIKFWRRVEASPRHCVAAADVAHVLICMASHAIFFVFPKALGIRTGYSAMG